MKSKFARSIMGKCIFALGFILLMIGILLSCSSDGTPDEAITTLLLAWNSDENLDGDDNNDNDIFFSRSTDRGISWSPTQILNSTATTDTNGDAFASLLTDGEGVWVVVWESNEDFGGADTDLDIFFSRSTDDGVTWSDVAHLNTNAADDTTTTDRQPHIFTDGNGVWIVMWESRGTEIGDNYDILYSRSVDNGASWSAPQILRTNVGTNEEDQRVHTATDSQGTWVTVWRSGEDLENSIGTDRDIVFSRSVDNGQNWNTPQPINSTAEIDGTTSDHRPDLFTDGQGVWVVVWFSGLDIGGANTDYDIFFSRSEDNGETWTDTAILNSNATNTSDDWRPDVMTDGSGTWLAVWQSYDNYQEAGSDWDIFFSRSTDDGENWSAVQHLNTNATSDTGEDARPSIVYIGNDTWITVWESDEDVNGSQATDDDILFSRSIDGGVTWSAPQLLNDNGTSDSGNDQFGYQGE